MNKKVLLSIVILAIAATAFVLLYRGGYLGKKPFKNLSADAIKKVMVFATPPGKTVAFNDKETLKELTGILHRVTIYRQDDSGRDYSGQLVQYTLILAAGDTYEVGAFGSFMYVDSICYRAKYAPSEELNALGNRIIQGD